MKSTNDRDTADEAAAVMSIKQHARASGIAFMMATAILGYGTGALRAEGSPPQITTPDAVEIPLGTLTFQKGIPTQETADKIYDQLDLTRAIDTYLNTLPAVSMYAIRKGFRDVGVKDGDVLVFSKLMDSKSLFLTANADTVYFWTFLDLKQGPVVVEAPPDVLGLLDDMWFRWIMDVGVSGPDRGLGGRYLIVPPGYHGPLPEGGYFVARARTMGITLLGRAFLEDNDPSPAAERIKSGLKIYPYSAGGYGSSIGTFLNGTGPLGQIARPQTPRFVEGSGLAMNTIPPNDLSFYEMLDSLVQEEPAEALDPEIAGQAAAAGIVKGKPLQPDARMRKILTAAVATGNAAARVLSIRPREAEEFRYYKESDSLWTNQLFVGGYEFLTPPPDVTKEGVRPYPNDGARKLDARSSMFYVATGITPAMVMRLPNIGSQYLGTFFDRQKKPLDGAKAYKITLPPHIPAAKFWSLTVYDVQTRSMLQTAQGFPRAGSQNFPSPAAEANSDGSTTIYFGPTRPASVREGNWIQTDPARTWWLMLRLYSPLKPFFDKSWRPGEIEAMND